MRIDGLPIGQIINNAVNTSDILSRLNAGDIVRAQIIEIASGEVLLKLLDGMTTRAATLTPVDARQGDFVNFLVKSKTDNQLILEAVKTNDKGTNSTEADLNKQLINMGIKPDEGSLEIAKQIKLNNLPLIKDTFDKVVSLIIKFKDLTPAKAAFLQAGNISSNEENISSLNRFTEGKAQLSSDIDELLGMLDHSEDRELLGNVAKDLKILNQAFKKVDLQGDGSAAKEILQQSGKNVVNLSAHRSFDNITDAFRSAPEFESLLKSTHTEGKITEQKLNEFLNTTIEDFENLPSDEKRMLSNFVKNLVEGMKGDKDVQYLSAKDKNPEDNIASMEKFKSDIHKSFESLFKKLEVESQNKDFNIKNLYKELYTKLETVKESILLSSPAAGNELLNKIDQMQNDIRFLNELNNYNTYVQIPLTIQGQNTTGDLYILKKGSKGKRLNPENLTMLISLNTTNIGQVDSVITVNKRNISVAMRVEDQDVFEIIRDNYKDLYNHLSEKGYKLVDLKYRLQEEKANILNMRQIIEKETNISKLSFDYKI